MCYKWDPLVSGIDDICVFYIGKKCLSLKSEYWYKKCPTAGKKPIKESKR